MRRLVVLGLAVAGVLTASGVASADHNDVAKPICADISTVSLFYSSDGVVTAGVETVEPSCKSITYTLYVIVDPGDPNSQIVTVSSRGGDDNDPVTPPNVLKLTTAPISDPDESPSQVCAYVTTSRGGQAGTNQLIDRAPNADATVSCVSLTAGGTPGDIGHA
jgi:hypothetical protein